MPAKLGNKSLLKLASCDERLKNLVIEAAKTSPIDFTVLCGHRGEDEQDEAFNSGKSKLPWPKSKHNSFPSMAVDLAPYPINWNDIKSFEVLWKHISYTAETLDIKIRSGADFNGNGNTSDDRFHDWPHFELV